MTVPFRAQTWFVTGASGLVGSGIVEKLRENDLSVIGLVRSTSPQHVIDWLVKLDVKIVYGDILDPESYQEYLATCDVVVHTAAAVQERDEQRNWLVNYEGTKRLVETMEEYGVRRLIHISTTGVYGVAQDEEVEEKQETKPYGAYLISKRAAEEFLQDKSSKLSISIIRPPFILGKPAFDRHVLPTLLGFGKNKIAFKIWRKNPRLAFAHTEDIASLVLLMGSRQDTNSLCYNVQSFDVRLDDLMTMAANAKSNNPFVVQIPFIFVYMGAAFLDFIDFVRRKPFGFRKRAKFARFNWIFSTEKAQKELGWAPQHLEAKELEIYLTDYVNLHEKTDVLDNIEKT